MDVTMPQLGETVTEGTITRWFKQVGEHGRGRRAAVRGVDRQGRLRGPVAGGGRAHRDPRARGRDGRGRRAPRGASATARRRAAPRPRPSARGRAGARGRGTAAAPAPEPRAGPAAAAPRRRAAPPPAPPRLPRRRTAARRRHRAPRRARGAGDGIGEVTSPVVRRLIAERGLDPAQITGTGEGGRITRRDVMNAVARPAPSAPAGARRAPAPAARRRHPPSRPRPRAVRARRRGRCRSTTSAAAPPSTWCARRRRARTCTRRSRSTSSGSSASAGRTRPSGRREEGFSLTYLPFIVRAFCDAVRDYPYVNASVDGETLVVHHDVHLGIAVDLDFKGLIAPVIRDADGKRLRLIAREIRDLATRARSKQLGPGRDHRRHVHDHEHGPVRHAR